MQKLLLLLLILCPTFCYSQTVTICSSTTPSGYVTLSLSSSCLLNNRITTKRVVQSISTLPANQTITIYDDPAPSGWVSTSLSDNGFTLIDGVSKRVVKRTIRKLSAVPINGVVDVVNEPVPAGWICVGISSTQVWTTKYLVKTIRRISDLASNQQYTIVDANVPDGWKTISMQSYGPVNGQYFLAKKISNYTILPTGATMNCYELPPSGWVTISMVSSGFINGSLYDVRTIKNIQGMPDNTVLNICADNIPPGWASTDIRAYGNVNGSYWYAHTIRKIQGLPLGSIVSVCGDVTHSGWTTITPMVVCKNVYASYYYSYNIKRTSMLKASEEDSTRPEIPSIPASDYREEGLKVIASPNPTNSNFDVKFEGIKLGDECQLTVLSISGTVLSTCHFIYDKAVKRIGSDLPSGLYIIKIRSSAKDAVTKVVKL